jgi:uncharacterized membrane protein YidH (DUF202 family)
MKASKQPYDHFLISHLQVRQAIGFIGIAMPFICILVEAVFNHNRTVQCCISSYYYTTANFAFVSTLSIIGALLFTYKGHSVWENRFANIAGAGALGTAFFPTDCQVYIESAYRYIDILKRLPPAGSAPDASTYTQIIHFSSAGIMLLVFGILSFFYFTNDDDIEVEAQRKKKALRNGIYKTCGLIVFASLATCIIIMFCFSSATMKHYWPKYLFFLESTALIPFGVAWVVKGSVRWNESKSAILRYFFSLLRG